MEGASDRALWRFWGPGQEPLSVSRNARLRVGMTRNSVKTSLSPRWRGVGSAVLITAILGAFLYWLETITDSPIKTPPLFGGFVLGAVTAITRDWWIARNGLWWRQWSMIGLWVGVIAIASSLGAVFETFALAAGGLTGLVLCESAKEVAFRED